MTRRTLTIAALAAAAVASPAAAVNMTSSAYSPGDAGPRTASGQPFRWDSNVVAHRWLPFGTRLAVSYRGRTSITTVQDRGPFIAGRDIDLGPVVWRWLGRGITDPDAWGERVVEVRVLGDPVRSPATRGPRQSGTGSGPARPLPTLRQAERSIRARARVLVRRYGYPWPVFDTNLTGRVATLVMVQQRGARTTCAPFGRSTTISACRSTVSTSRVVLTRIRVEEDGSTRVLRRVARRA